MPRIHTHTPIESPTLYAIWIKQWTETKLFRPHIDRRRADFLSILVYRLIPSTLYEYSDKPFVYTENWLAYVYIVYLYIHNGKCTIVYIVQNIFAVACAISERNGGGGYFFHCCCCCCWWFLSSFQFVVVFPVEENHCFKRVQIVMRAHCIYTMLYGTGMYGLYVHRYSSMV